MFDLARLIACRDQAARLVLEDAVYVPIFERWDREVRAREKNDPVERARAMIGVQA